MVDGSTHVRRLEKRPILLEKTLVVAQMVRVHFEKVADVREALGSRNGADRMSIYGDSNGFLRRQNFLGAGERDIAMTETDAFRALVLCRGFPIVMRTICDNNREVRCDKVFQVLQRSVLISFDGPCRPWGFSKQVK